MPSRAAYIALAVARSDTGCSTILIPWVEEPVMVTPEVVGHMDPAGLPGLRSSAHGFFHERTDPCLVGCGQLGQGEGGRPHGALVDVRRVAEDERRVPRPELLRWVGEADDLAVL